MKKEYQFGGLGQGKQFIIIDGNYLTIKRKGVLQAINQGLKGDKTINIRNITSVQVKKPGMTTGYIQFVLMGSHESKGGVMHAVSDENTVIFSNGSQYKHALEIKEYIEKLNNEPVTQTVIQQSTISVADEIRKLKELLDEGLLTQEEFDEQKKRLLS